MNIVRAQMKPWFSERVKSCAIAPLGPQVKPQFFTDDSAEKPSHRMHLPGGGAHHVFECRAAWFFQQSQNLSGADSSCTFTLRLLGRLLSGFGVFFPLVTFRSCWGFFPFCRGFPFRHGDDIRALPLGLSWWDRRFRRVFKRWFKGDLHVLGILWFQSFVMTHRTHSSLSPGVNASNKTRVC